MLLSEARIIEILCDLEKRLPKRDYSVYIPTALFNSGDSVSVQKEASLMMKHLGLNDYITLVTYEKTDENTGGYINLNHSKEVFITINEESRNRKNQVLAIMAHEICHKFLYVNGIHFSPQQYGDLIEWYTDLATIFVGFYHLTLNGCDVIDNSMNRDTRIMTTSHHKTGYLAKSNYEFATSYVKSAREKEKVDLNTLKKAALHNYADANQQIWMVENILSYLRSELKNKLSNVYNALSDITEKSGDLAIYKAQTELQSAAEDYFEHISLKDFALDYSKQISNEIRKKIVRSRLVPVCPNCGYTASKERQENTIGYLRCPQCKREFCWDTTEDNILQESSSEVIESKSKISKFFKKFGKK